MKNLACSSPTRSVPLLVLTRSRNDLGLLSTAVLILLMLCVQACQRPARSNPSHPRPTSTNVFDAYLNTNIPPADGFDFPVGDANAKGLYKDLATGIEYNGWRIDTHFAENYQLGIHTGEDWNGNGGGNTDLGQDVHAVANGRVTFAQNCGRLWGNVITVEHHFYENHEHRKIISLYAHLNEIKVKEGAVVQRRQVIATIGQDPDKTYSPTCTWNCVGTTACRQLTGRRQTGRTKRG